MQLSSLTVRFGHPRSTAGTRYASFARGVWQFKFSIDSFTEWRGRARPRVLSKESGEHFEQRDKALIEIFGQSESMGHLNASGRNNHAITHELSIRPLHARPGEALRINLQAAARNNKACSFRGDTSCRKTAKHED